MNVAERLESDLKAAMKARDDLRIQVLRMLKSDLSYKRIELGRDLTQDDIVTTLSTAVKSRKEAGDEYLRGGRADLADKESAEIKIIQEYLPEQLSTEELNILVDKTIAETGAITIKDLGAVMKNLMPAVRGRADGKEVNAAVKARLNGK